MTAPPENARTYARIKRRLMLFDMAAGFAWLAVTYWSGWSATLAGWWAERFTSQPVIVLGYLAMFGAVYSLVMLPLHFYSSFLLEHRFGLSRMTITDWLVREGKQLAVGGVISAVLVEALYALLDRKSTRLNSSH